MEYTYNYSDKQERQVKITEAEGLVYRMLHDDFSPDWKHGDEPRGVMTFTDVMPPSPPEPEPPRDLAKEVTSLEQRITKIEGILL